MVRVPTLRRGTRQSRQRRHGWDPSFYRLKTRLVTTLDGGLFLLGCFYCKVFRLLNVTAAATEQLTVDGHGLLHGTARLLRLVRFSLRYTLDVRNTFRLFF